jgi:hypothetical protein
MTDVPERESAAKRFRWIEVVETLLSIIVSAVLIWGHLNGVFF